MTHRQATGPSREELAAYADGELAGADRARVQEWLIANPDAAAEVADLRRLDWLYRTTAPVEPDEQTWANVFQRIERAAEQPSRPRQPLLRRIVRVLVPLTAAAVVLLMVSLQPAPLRQPLAERIEPFPVASADDVEIISLADADQRSLLIGRPPLFEPMVLGRPNDMSDLDIRPDTDGMVPTVRPIEGGSVVIVAPLAWSGVDEKED
jgi:hypothetical protein